jgi:hypothetical protein
VSRCHWTRLAQNRSFTLKSLSRICFCKTCRHVRQTQRYPYSASSSRLGGSRTSEFVNERLPGDDSCGSDKLFDAVRANKKKRMSDIYRKRIFRIHICFMSFYICHLVYAVCHTALRCLPKTQYNLCNLFIK